MPEVRDDATPLMIKTVDLRVDYDTLTAVDHVNLAVPAGEIYGLIGPNGAGKSSTMRVLATLQEPTYGDVYIAGYDVNEQRRDVHRVLGYMPDFAPVYDDLTLREFLTMFASAHAIPRADLDDRVDAVLTLAKLTDRVDQKAGTLSRGLKQRLVLAKTLLHEPRVLLLDEPASGLDPKARIELRDMLRAIVRGGKTVLISSHILTELEGFCTSIGIMRRGQLVLSGSVADVIKELQPSRRFEITLLEPSPRAAEVLAHEDDVEIVKGEGASEDPRVLRVDLGDADDVRVARILSTLVRADVDVVTFAERRMNVEDVFMQINADEDEGDLSQQMKKEATR